MFTSIDQFKDVWKQETTNTTKILDALTDESLAKPEHDNIRTLGREAWHLVTTYPEMCARFDIITKGVGAHDPVPSSAGEIADAYKMVTSSVFKAVSGWSDADLQTEDDMYGETWKRGKSLFVVLLHEIHHRAQMTILMRLAGLKVPGLYGPSKEEWVNYGMQAPEV